MLNVVTVAALGFLLGVRHATDADHVIAVSTIVSRQRSIRTAGLTGMLWGCGHTLTILAVGTAIILFKVTITPRVGLAMELAVGLMLVVLGVLNLTGVMQRASESVAPRDNRIGWYSTVRPLIVGIVHGLAGSAAVALLVLATIPNPLWAVGYLLVFGVGTIAGMMLMTIAIGAPFVLTERHAQFGGRLAAACGLISVSFGLLLSYRICFVDGLFAG